MILKFQEFLNEEAGASENTMRARFMISKKGELVEKEGNIIFGKGIYDDEGLSYVAAIGEDGVLYKNIKDANSLFRVVDQNRYNPEESPEWKTDEL